MMAEYASALIVARPGPLRDGLHALVTAIPQIETAYDVDDACSALKMTFEHRPVLIILDSGRSGSEVGMMVRRARARWPQARCILLINDVQQQREAEAAGADAVLLKGFPAARLAAMILRLLPQQRA